MAQRKSAARLKAEGTFRADRGRNDPTIEPLVSLPRAPASLDKGAQAEWRRLGGACIRRGTLTIGDVSALERAAEACAIAGRLAREASDSPTYSIGAAGQSVVHPIFASAKSWGGEARAWLGVLGLSPSTRSSVEAVRVQVESDLDKFLKRKTSIKGNANDDR